MKKKIVLYLILILLSAAFIIPFVYMVSIALASDATANRSAYTIFPHEFEFKNIIRIFTEGNVGIWLRNSLFLTTVNTVLTLMSSSMVAYGFSRFRVKGKSVIFMILLSTMMIPSQVTLIPQFVIFRKLGWINTMLPLIVPNMFGSAFYIFMLRQFIMRLPISLDEAAKIDGMSYFGIYFKIILPLIKPVMTAVAILSVISNWNWYFEPMIYLNSTDKYPLSIGVQIMSAVGHAGQQPLWNLMMSAALILVVPMIVLFLIGQKYMFELNINVGSAGIK